MMPEYDLVRQPWIPCESSGVINDTSLFDVLANAHLIAAVTDPCPPVTVSLYRLLLAVLHRVFGPGDQEEWQRLWVSGRFDTNRLESYFDEWEESFDLFSARTPFYQDPALADPGMEHLTKPLAWIMHELASGNNPTLFDHTTTEAPVTLTPAQAARRLVAFQAYALPGIVTHEGGKTISGKGGPLVDRAVFLALGSNLFETLVLNMVKYDPASELPFAGGGTDAPAWEKQPDCAPCARLPAGYLDWLTWQSRRMLLSYVETETSLVVESVRVHLGASLPEDIGSEGYETMVAYIGKKDKPKKPVMFREGRGLWRDFYSTVESFRETTSDTLRSSPRTLQWLGSLSSDGIIDRGVMPLGALGLSKDPGNAAKVWLWRHDSLSLPVPYLTESGLSSVLRKALESLESIGRELSAAFYRLAKELDPGGSVPSHRNPYYWTQAESLFRRCAHDMVIRDPQEVLDEFMIQIRRAALEDFDQSVNNAGSHANALRASVKQRVRLVRGINKAIGG
jgi:CRISPR system Cascade subunit CasA